MKIQSTINTPPSQQSNTGKDISNLLSRTKYALDAKPLNFSQHSFLMTSSA
jgi:hypothetical protein